jgi:hypothetical protein
MKGNPSISYMRATMLVEETHLSRIYTVKCATGKWYLPDVYLVNEWFKKETSLRRGLFL